MTGKTLIVRTSDRAVFKRCRRKWNWTSSARGNLQSQNLAAPLWVGSGFHYAMEDFHGYKNFDRASDAYRAYSDATKMVKSTEMPDDWKEQLQLACNMLDFYQDNWLRNRDPLPTYVIDGVPQCEVKFHIPIPLDFPDEWEIDEAIYQGTFDRIAIDRDGRLWIVEYKTAKNMVHEHYQTDQQVTSYCWAADLVFHPMKVAGVVYQQHRKTLPVEPKLLAKGTYSVNKQQATSFNLYRDCLINLHTSVEKAPKGNREFLDMLREAEHIDSDPFIHREFVFRNKTQFKNEEKHILQEVMDMANPNLPLYPNPTRDCSWDCNPFNSPCVSMDDGGDWELEIELSTTQRGKDDSSWREHLRLPQ